MLEVPKTQTEDDEIIHRLTRAGRCNQPKAWKGKWKGDVTRAQNLELLSWSWNWGVRKANAISGDAAERREWARNSPVSPFPEFLQSLISVFHWPNLAQIQLPREAGEWSLKGSSLYNIAQSRNQQDLVWRTNKQMASKDPSRIKCWEEKNGWWELGNLGNSSNMEN